MGAVKLNQRNYRNMQNLKSLLKSAILVSKNFGNTEMQVRLQSFYDISAQVRLIKIHLSPIVKCSLPIIISTKEVYINARCFYSWIFG